MSVFVIGSGGFMGRHLLAALAKEGVHAVGSSSADGTGIDPKSGLLPDNFTVPRGTSVVVYMAQSPYFRQVPEQAAHVLAVNALSVARAAVLARAAGVRRFIYISTGTVYAPSFLPLREDAPVRRDSWYALSKLHGEEAINLFRSDMEIIVVRPFGVYGPNQTGRLVTNLLDSVLNGKPISLQPRPDCPADQDGLKISLCYIDDATHILVRLIHDGGEPCLNLAGGEVLTIRSIANQIGMVTGRTPALVPSDWPRDSDLIADTEAMNRSVSVAFTPFSEGLHRTVAMVS